MMKKLVALVLLASLTFMTGCFTTINAVAGSKSKSSDPYAGNKAVVMAAVLDAVIIAVLISQIDEIPIGTVPDTN